MEFHAVQELPVHQENVFVHLAILVMQTTWIKAVIYEVNVTSIKTVKIQKFASNSVVVFVIVLMLVRNLAVDQMPCVFQVIIVQHVFVVMDLWAIQMTLI